MREESGRNHSTHKLYTQTSPRAAHLEHDGLAPLHLTCPQGQLRSQSIADHIRELPEMRAPTLRLRQPSHEKALFRGSAVFKGTSAMPGLDSSTTMGGIHMVQDSTRTHWKRWRKARYDTKGRRKRKTGPLSDQVCRTQQSRKSPVPLPW